MDPSLHAQTESNPSSIGVVPQAGNEDTERKELELQKLRREIAELSLQWWKRPPYIASIATITAAIVSVSWLVLSGFFDVSRRELAVHKRELEVEIREISSARDAQSLAFQRERQAQASRTALLQKREEKLRQDIEKLDKPIVTDSEVIDAPWFATGSPLQLHFIGTNLSDVSTQSVEFTMNCSATPFHWASPESRVAADTTMNSETEVRLKVDARSLKSAVAHSVHNYAPPEQSEDSLSLCVSQLVVRLHRGDGKMANSRIVPIPAAIPWALTP